MYLLQKRENFIFHRKYDRKILFLYFNTNSAKLKKRQNIVESSGSITHLNYRDGEDLRWEIQPECENVNIYSTEFSTESGYDYLHLNSDTFSGTIDIKGMVRT